MDLTRSRNKFMYVSIICIVLLVFSVYSLIYFNSRDSPIKNDKNNLEVKGIPKKKTSSRLIPNVIIQFGYSRTATTLQFSILCLIMALLHENEIERVHCDFKETKTNYKYTVMKTHQIELLLDSVPRNSWIFMTSSDKHKSKINQVRQKIENKNITVPYIADISLVSIRKQSIVYEYQPIFGLSNDQMHHLVEYFRYWDILRVCCGIQMSSDWRNNLAPRVFYKQHHDLHSSMYPACEMYDIGQVEKLMRKTYLFDRFAQVDSLRNAIGRPSLVDGFLDGTYCERCNINITKHKLEMNRKCG